MNTLQYLGNDRPRRGGPLALLLWLLPLFAASPVYAGFQLPPPPQPPAVPRCDVDGDGDVDKDDIQLILSVRNQPVANLADPRDADGDHVITVKDARKCTLSCTLSRCRIVPVTISATTIPMGGGDISGTGDYTPGSTVTLTATPNPGFDFVDWTRDGTVVSTDPTYTFTVTAADRGRTLVANFTTNGALLRGSKTPYRAESFPGYYKNIHDPGFHPLLRGRTSLIRSEELVMLNINTAGFIQDNKEKVGDEYVSSPLESMAPVGGPLASYRAAGHADVDGDGREELIILRDRDIQVYTVNLDGSAQSQKTLPNAGGSLQVDHLTTGDLDGDGADDLIVYGICSNSPIACAYAYLSSHPNDLPAQILWLRGARDRDIAMATGDFDKDGRDEVFLLGHEGDIVKASILDDAYNRFADMAALNLPSTWLDNGNYEILEVGAVVADINGDGRLDAVAAAIRRDNYGGVGDIFMQALNVQVKDGAKILAGGNQSGKLTVMPNTTEQRNLQSPDYSPGPHEHWLLARADLNHDYQDEIVSTLREFDGFNYACRFDMFAFNNNAVSNPFKQPVVTIFEGSSEATNNSRCAMAVLDNDRDGSDEVILGRLDPPSVNDTNYLSRREIDTTFQCTAFEGNTCKKGAGRYEVTSTPLPQEIMDHNRSNPRPLVFIGADFDGDNLTVKYTGNKRKVVSDIRILALISAPPTQDGLLTQNLPASETTITLSKTLGTEVGFGYSATSNVTISIGLPGLLDIGLFDFGVSAFLERTISRNRTLMQATEVGDIVSAGAGFDKIQYWGTLYESYEYEIIAVPDKDKQDLIGSRITINEPIENQVWNTSVAYFNTHVAPSQQIHPSHTPGDITSYPSRSEKDALKNEPGVSGFLESKPEIVGNGAGYTGAILKITQENASQFEESQSVGLTTDFNFLGLGTTYTRALGKNATYTISIGQSVEYEGNVGDICDQYEYEKYMYKYGLFVYWKQETDGTKYYVVDYWVDLLGDGPWPPGPHDITTPGC